MSPTHPLVDEQALTTYRYLRMSLVTVLAMLAAAVLVQTFWGSSTGPPDLANPDWETSISYYYWTPVRAVFIGSLIAMGVGMVVLKADNEVEDILLNIGGVLAPLVALVPTPQHCVVTDAGGCTTPPLPADIVEGIRNNVSALLLAGVLAVVIFVLLTRRAATRPTPQPRSIVVARRVGFGITFALLVGGYVWFYAGRDSFQDHAHLYAAVTLFACIVLVVLLNAVTQLLLRRKGAPRASVLAATYLAIVGLMLLVGVIGVVVHSRPEGTSFLLIEQAYAILFLEAGILFLFMCFWIVQSVELWDRGTRLAPTQRNLLPSKDALPQPEPGPA